MKLSLGQPGFLQANQTLEADQGLGAQSKGIFRVGQYVCQDVHFYSNFIPIFINSSFDHLFLALKTLTIKNIKVLKISEIKIIKMFKILRCWNIRQKTLRKEYTVTSPFGCWLYIFKSDFFSNVIYSALKVFRIKSFILAENSILLKNPSWIIKCPNYEDDIYI